MLVIRKEQLTVLEEYSQTGFERELCEHVNELAPRHSAAVGKDAVRELVRLGIERAENYGFDTRGPVRFYIEMMCLFGSDFDTDHQLPWAEAVLRNENIADQAEKADALFDQMLEYEEAVIGPEKQYYLNALSKLSKIRFEDYDLKRNFDVEVTRGLETIYPQKCKDLGSSGLEKLIGRGKDIAAEHAVNSERGMALFIALAFMLGHGFAHDAFFPWIAKTMADEDTEANDKAERVYTKLKLYLEAALED